MSEERIAFTEHEMTDLKASLQRGSMQPRDHLIRLKSVAARNTITCAQLLVIIDVTRTIPVEVCVLLHPSLSDPDAFESVLQTLKWEDQRADIRKQLGLQTPSK